VRSAILKGFAFPVVSRKLPLYPWAGSDTTGPGPVSGGRNSSPTPAFNHPTVLDGEKLGVEASCREKGPWPFAGPNAAQAQNRLAKIVRAAMRFLLLLTDGSAGMVGRSPILLAIFSLPESRKSTSDAARDTASALLAAGTGCRPSRVATLGDLLQHRVGFGPGAGCGFRSLRYFCRTGESGGTVPFDPERPGRAFVSAGLPRRHGFALCRRPSARWTGRDASTRSPQRADQLPNLMRSLRVRVALLTRFAGPPLAICQAA